MDELRIDPVGPAVAGRIAALARRIWREHYPAIIGREQTDYMLDRYQSPAAIIAAMADGYRYCLIRVGHRAIGYLACRVSGEVCELSKLYLAAGFRGRGWGRSALAWVEARGREAGARMVRLRVNRRNRISLAVYAACGYRRVEDVIDDIGAGYVIDDHIYAKVL
ncbi:MAG: GNAT family N-acetyltransferase [Planctomycetota bacterium]